MSVIGEGFSVTSGLGPEMAYPDSAIKQTKSHNFDE